MLRFCQKLSFLCLVAPLLFKEQKVKSGMNVAMLNFRQGQTLSKPTTLSPSMQLNFASNKSLPTWFHSLQGNVLANWMFFFVFFVCSPHLRLKTLRIRRTLSTILKTRKRSVWSNVFWYAKVCIFWKCIQYSIHWDITQMLKKILRANWNRTKNALFFLSRAPTHHSFTCNLWFSYELKHKVRLSKTMRGILHLHFLHFY